jgi:hypothetical protein
MNILNHQNVIKPYLGNESLTKYANTVNSVDQTNWYITNGYGQYIALSENKANDYQIKDAFDTTEIIREKMGNNERNQIGIKMKKPQRIFQIYLGSLTVVGLLVIFKMIQSQR